MVRQSLTYFGTLQHFIKKIDSPQVKQYFRSTANNIVYDLPKNLRLMILGNLKKIERCRK